MRTYEVMVIHRPELAEQDVRSLVGDVEGFLEKRGAELEETDFWGKRRFAYEIDHLREGYYSVIRFRSEPHAVDDLERVLALADSVVRHKVVRLEVAEGAGTGEG